MRGQRAGSNSCVFSGVNSVVAVVTTFVFRQEGRGEDGHADTSDGGAEDSAAPLKNTVGDLVCQVEPEALMPATGFRVFRVQGLGFLGFRV